MASKLEGEDRVRDAAFNKAMHGKSSTEKTAFMAMLQKDKAAQSAAVDEYFKFWDGKGAGKETEVDMAVGSSFPPSTQDSMANKYPPGTCRELCHIDKTVCFFKLRKIQGGF